MCLNIAYNFYIYRFSLTRLNLFYYVTAYLLQNGTFSKIFIISVYKDGNKSFKDKIFSDKIN
jgi:hypothetical protein